MSCKYGNKLLLKFLGRYKTHCYLPYGCKLDEESIKVDKKQQTTVPQVFAAGDVDTDRHFVVLAVASGALAAISICEDILKEALQN
jgi:thioredoxin reductase